MTIFQAIVLGLVQGLTEFLPVSSSAHLALTPWLLGWQDPGLAFDVALHLGTLVAVLWYFRQQWRELVVAAWGIARTRRIASEAERRVLLLVLGTIPAGVAGLLAKDAAETIFRAPALTASALIVMGTLLWAADRWAPAARPLSQLTVRDAVLIGVAQMFALIPGVSRSGSTITAARALGIDRQSAAVFSFLLSLPITTAATIVKVPEAIAGHGLSAPLVAGVIAAAVSSWLAIAVLLRFVSKYSYGVFALYRWALGIAVLTLLATRGA
ncbi:MAG: undecaprenyl-diphosphatase UppP [Gemmatimonadaceae bacterium]|jgi:undecaprenyl-diphosphatase|nr:undecaprenyl-diphosphatase UppP [Gemmatimonadaceae bacterium]